MFLTFLTIVKKTLLNTVENTVYKPCHLFHVLLTYSRFQSIYPTAPRICAAPPEPTAHCPVVLLQHRSISWRTCKRHTERSRKNMNP